MRALGKFGIIATTLALGVSASPVQLRAQTLVPYQKTASINVSNCSGNQCIVSYPTVPAGKRLVLTSVSAQLGTLNPIVLEGGAATYFVSKTDPSLTYLNAQVSFYYEPGSTPTARMFAPPGTPNTSLIVTLVGYLTPAN
jgi:hypothetical protein